MKSLACLAAFVVLASMSSAQTPAAGSAKGTPPAKMLSQVIDWQKLAFTPTKTGQRVAVFEAPTPTLDKFHCHISTLNPGENTGPLHRHPQEELVIIKEGTLEINIDGKIQTATAGSMIFYSANENENMRNIGKTPATYYVIQFWTPQTPKE
jgi:mannose-6-phosphate isomerase-like protein (cupin superfamily)